MTVESLRQGLKAQKDSSRHVSMGDEDYAFNGAIRQLAKASGERNETCGELKKTPRHPLATGGWGRAAQFMCKG